MTKKSLSEIQDAQLDYSAREEKTEIKTDRKIRVGIIGTG